MTEVRGIPVDYTGVGYEALRTSMLEIARRTVPEWTDHSENDLGVLLVELMAYASDLTLYYQTRIAAQLFPTTCDEPDALVPLLRLLGHELQPAAPATADLELLVDAAAPLPLTIAARTAFVATPPDSGPLRFEAVRDTVLDHSVLERVEGGGRRFLPLPVVEGTTVAGEVVGTSDGSAGQLFPLGRSPVLKGSVELEVAEPEGTTRWREVRSLSTAGPADRVFAVQRAADGRVTVVLGDGHNGRVPRQGGLDSPARVLATYRVGGGPQGNVAPGTRFTCSLPAVRSAVAPAGAAGGAPAEDLDRARQLAPRLHRTQERAVTAGDHVDLALATAGVGKAVAVPVGWNEVHLYVAPTGRVADPGELLRRDLLAAFERTRMAGTTVEVRGPVPVPVHVRLSVQAEPHYLQSEVRLAVEQAVGALLSFDAVDFGQALYLSRVYDAAQSLPAVHSLVVTQFSRDVAGGVDAGGVIQLSPVELPCPGHRPAVLVTVTGGVP